MTDFQMKKDNKFVITNSDNEEELVSSDDIIKMPDGTLSTMYHYLNDSKLEDGNIEPKPEVKEVTA